MSSARVLVFRAGASGALLIPAHPPCQTLGSVSSVRWHKR